MATEKRLPSYTSKEAPAWAGQARGAERLGPGRVWASVHAAEGWARIHGPRPASRGRDARIRLCPIGSYLLVLGSCDTIAAGLANEVLYNTRSPYTDPHSRIRRAGQGRGPRFERAPEKEILLCRYRAGTLPLNSPRLEQSERVSYPRTLVQTYRRIMQSVRQPASQSVSPFSHVRFLLAQPDAKRRAYVRNSHTIPFLTLVSNLVSQLFLAAPPPLTFTTPREPRPISIGLPSAWFDSSRRNS